MTPVAAPARFSVRTLLDHRLPGRLALGAALLVAASCTGTDRVLKAAADAPLRNVAEGEASTADIAGEPATYTDGEAPEANDLSPNMLSASLNVAPAADPSGVVRIYKDHDAWSFGGGRDEATLQKLGKVKGVHYFVHPMGRLTTGIPSGTSVVIITANSFGSPATSAAQRSPQAQAALAAFLGTGGVLLIDLADNDFGDGYRAPGATGTPSYIFPATCIDASLTAEAYGPDGVPSTRDDHRFVRGPDGLAATSDDLNDQKVDMWGSCWVVHGNLRDGITLPTGAKVLATVRWPDGPRPVMAEYCHEGGRVVLNTFTLGFDGQQPQGQRWSYIQESLFSYALSAEAACKAANQAPTVSLGSSTGDEASSISFAANAQDPDGDALTYAWDFTNDGTPDVTTKEPSASWTFDDNGSYPVTVTVDDKNGGTASASATATVINIDPTATIAATSPVNEGTSFTVSLSNATDVSAADRAAGFTFAFDCTGTGSSFGDYSADASASCSTDDNGTRTAKAKVRDKDGGETEYTVDVTVLNVAPTVNAGPDQTVTSGQIASLSGSFTDPGVKDYAWQWAWSSGQSGEAMSQAQALLGSYKACQAGTHTVTLAVTDKDQGTGTDNAVVTVQRFGVSIDVLGEAINLNPSGDDGGMVIVHVYSADGFDATTLITNTVRLTNGAGSGTSIAIKNSGAEFYRESDLNGDGRRDALIHFRRDELVANGDLTASTSRLTLLGDLEDCRQVSGSDRVVVVP